MRPDPLVDRLTDGDLGLDPFLSDRAAAARPTFELMRRGVGFSTEDLAAELGCRLERDCVASAVLQLSSYLGFSTQIPVELRADGIWVWDRRKASRWATNRPLCEGMTLVPWPWSSSQLFDQDT